MKKFLCILATSIALGNITSLMAFDFNFNGLDDFEFNINDDDKTENNDFNFDFNGLDDFNFDLDDSFDFEFNGLDEFNFNLENFDFNFDGLDDFDFEFDGFENFDFNFNGLDDFDFELDGLEDFDFNFDGLEDFDFEFDGLDDFNFDFNEPDKSQPSVKDKVQVPVDLNNINTSATPNGALSFDNITKIELNIFNIPVKVEEADVTKVTVLDSSVLKNVPTTAKNTISFSNGVLKLNQYSSSEQKPEYVEGSILIQVPDGKILDYQFSSFGRNIKLNTPSK